MQDSKFDTDKVRGGRSGFRDWDTGNHRLVRWRAVELPAPGRKTIDLEGRIVKEGVGKTVTERQAALNDLVKAIREFRKFTDQPLTLRGSEYAQPSRS